MVVPYLQKYLDLCIRLNKDSESSTPTFSLFTSIDQYNDDQIITMTRYLVNNNN